MAKLHDMVLTLAAALVAAVYAGAAHAEFPKDLFAVATQTKLNLDERLRACGTNRFDPQDPRLPRPQITASEAYANLDVPWLAGYYQTEPFGLVDNFTYKWPNGGNVAWMQLVNHAELDFATSAGGVRARMVPYATVAGISYYLYCGSTLVDEATFRQCVETQFALPLLQSFCWHG